jgi:hypothetical protein
MFPFIAAFATSVALLAPGCTIEVHYPGEGVPKRVDSDVVEGDVFEEPPPPVIFEITGIAPSEGFTEGGTAVTVAGNLLQDAQQVLFDGIAGHDLVSLGPKGVRVHTPAGAPGEVDVTVVRGDGKSVTLTDGFRYDVDLQLDLVVPSSGAAIGGEIVEVHGQGLVPGTQVLIGGRLALSVTSLNSETLQALVPEGTPGWADVYVSNEHGFERLRDGYRYLDETQVQSVWPPTGPAAGGNLVTVTGTGLSDVMAVILGGSEAPILGYWGDGALSIEAPPGPPGSATLTLITPDADVVVEYAYGWLGPEQIPGEVLSISPPRGGASGGDELVVGVAGIASLDEPVIRLGDELGVTEEVDAEFGAVRLIAPAISPGLHDVALAADAPPNVLEAAYEALPALLVTSVDPAFGDSAGGEPVVLEGVGFSVGVDVRIGALPASDVWVVSDTRIEAITPAGSPGVASVRVRQGNTEHVLVSGFEFTVDAPELIAMKPTFGAQAGGTFLRILGVGLEPPVAVYFGSTPALDVQLHGSTLITARSPAGEKSTVDVLVQAGGHQRVFVEGWSFFDPTGAYGGAWGGPIDEAVNVSVLDAQTGAPVAGAFVVLGANPSTPYQGLANGEGEITFGGPGLFGKQTVTASAPSYSTHSTVHIDATNLVIQLYPYSPPSTGPPGVVLDPGAVTGRITGMDKYVILPPGSCEGRDPGAFIYCLPCETDAECGPVGACLPIADGKTWCTTHCGGVEDCPPGYGCASVPGGIGPHCVPSPGEKTAQCAISEQQMFSPGIAPGPGAVASMDPITSVWTYEIASRIGEVAVVCRGGYTDAVTGKFMATTLGVRRHVFVGPETLTEDIDVPLDFPLTGRVEVRLDGPPLAPEGPHVLLADLYLELGSDGWLPMGALVQSVADAPLEFPRLPATLFGVLYDATWTAYAGTYTGEGRSPPASIAQARGLVDMGLDAVFQRGASGDWEAVPTPPGDDLRGIHGVEEQAWIVGDSGVILHRFGSFWAKQSVPTSANLLAVHGTASDAALAVGEDGVVLRWDGWTWESQESPTSRALHAVWGSADGHAFAAGWHVVMHRAPGGAWTEIEVPLERAWNGVWGRDSSDVWVVGESGSALHFDGNEWTAQALPTTKDLHGAWSDPGSPVVVVGEAGVMLVQQGAGWTPLKTGTSRTLRTAWGREEGGELVVYVGGAGGTLIRVVAGEATFEDFQGSASEIQGVWASADAPGLTAVGTRSIVLGPFMQVPSIQAGTLTDAGIPMAIEVLPGPDPHFLYATIVLENGYPLWTLLIDGEVEGWTLPNLGVMAGLEPLPLATKRVWMYSVYREGFDIDAFSGLDLNSSDWRAWSVINPAVEGL